MRIRHAHYHRGAFAHVAKVTAFLAGHPIVFSGAVLTILGWAALGPLFGFSDTWQLVINTATTIITFLMVFLIQNTQNRESHAVQIKLDELIRATKGAHVSLLDLEELPDDQLQRLQHVYTDLAQRARQRLARGQSDTGTPRTDGQPDSPQSPEPRRPSPPRRGAE